MDGMAGTLSPFRRQLSDALFELVYYSFIKAMKTKLWDERFVKMSVTVFSKDKGVCHSFGHLVYSALYKTAWGLP